MSVYRLISSCDIWHFTNFLLFLQTILNNKQIIKENEKDFIVMYCFVGNV